MGDTATAAPAAYEYDEQPFDWDGPWRQITLDSERADNPGDYPGRIGVYSPVPFFPDGYGVVNGERVPCLHGTTMCPACEGDWRDYVVRTFQEHGPVGYLAGCRCPVCAAPAA